MKTLTLVTACVLVLGGLAIQPAAGQSFLDRLESTLKEGLNAVLPKSDAPQADPAKPDTAKPAPGRTYLGLVGNDADNGVRVMSVHNQGPAERAGLQPEDVITAINGQSVRSMDDMGKVLQALKPGDRAEFAVQRQGQRQTLNVTLGTKPAETPKAPEVMPPALVPPPLTSPPTPVPPKPADVLPAPAARGPVMTAAKPSLGITVKDVLPEERIVHGIVVNQGAMVSSVRVGSPAAAAGIPVGAVIVALDGRRIGSAQDLVQQIRGARVGQEVELSYYLGDRLVRSRLQLAADTTVAAPPPPTPLAPGVPLSAPRTGARGPLLDRVEGLLDRFVPPPVAQPPPPVATEAGDVAELRQQVETLRAQVETLQKRLAELEARTKAQP